MDMMEYHSWYYSIDFGNGETKEIFERDEAWNYFYDKVDRLKFPDAKLNFVGIQTVCCIKDICDGK